MAPTWLSHHRYIPLRHASLLRATLCLLVFLGIFQWSGSTMTSVRPKLYNFNLAHTTRPLYRILQALPTITARRQIQVTLLVRANSVTLEPHLSSKSLLMAGLSSLVVVEI